MDKKIVYCIKCGVVLKEMDVFCRECGTRLVMKEKGFKNQTIQKTSMQSSPHLSELSIHKKKFNEKTYKPIALIGLCVIIMLLIAGWGYTSYNKENENKDEKRDKISDKIRIIVENEVSINVVVCILIDGEDRGLYEFDADEGMSRWFGVTGDKNHKIEFFWEEDCYDRVPTFSEVKYVNNRDIVTFIISDYDMDRDGILNMEDEDLDGDGIDNNYDDYPYNKEFSADLEVIESNMRNGGFYGDIYLKFKNPKSFSIYHFKTFITVKFYDGYGDYWKENYNTSSWSGNILKRGAIGFSKISFWDDQNEAISYTINIKGGPRAEKEEKFKKPDVKLLYSEGEDWAGKYKIEGKIHNCEEYSSSFYIWAVMYNKNGNLTDIQDTCKSCSGSETVDFYIYSDDYYNYDTHETEFEISSHEIYFKFK